jgi:hypothetical protein
MWKGEVSLAPARNYIVHHHDICLDVDSYIFAYTGRRGGGKTTSMTDGAAKASFLYPKMRLLSNYPIEFTARYLDGHTRHIKSEDLNAIGWLEVFAIALLLLSSFRPRVAIKG